MANCPYDGAKLDVINEDLARCTKCFAHLVSRRYAELIDLPRQTGTDPIVRKLAAAVVTDLFTDALGQVEYLEVCTFRGKTLRRLGRGYLLDRMTEVLEHALLDRLTAPEPEVREGDITPSPFPTVPESRIKEAKNPPPQGERPTPTPHPCGSPPR